LRLNDSENTQLLVHARSVWEAWGDRPGDALGEFGGEEELAVATIRCLGGRFGVTAESVAADLILWFNGPGESYVPHFAHDITNAVAQVMSTDAINVALGTVLLCRMIEGATYEIRQDVELRLLGTAFNCLLGADDQ
jgi:hypothetical protein